MSKLKHFLNDRDGVSQRDFLLVISAGVFFLFVSVGLIMILLGRTIDSMYLELLGTVSPVVIAITTGIFGIQITQEIKKKNNTSEIEQQPKTEDIIDEEMSIEDYRRMV